MSIVFGIYNRKDKGLKKSNIETIDTALSYWDCDEKHIWGEGSVALGHRMLWNTPQSKLEHLPCIIHHNNQLLAITIDARLDNRETLATQLEISDLPLDTITDSELILAAYRKWGEVCPKYLLGDFVFVIWDADKEKLFCARDQIGIKPFYYHLSDDLFVFSNDINGVIAHPGVSKKYNDRSIAMFLDGEFGFYDERDTFYEEIRKLPAATTMTISKEEISESVYWSVEDIPEIHYDTYEEYVEKLRELLFDAVKVRLRTEYSVASHLSGGLDSSAISVLAARELKKRDQLLYAFNWVETANIECPPDLPERSFAIQIANLENIEQKNIDLTPEFIVEMFDKIDISTKDTSFYWGEYLVRNEAEKYGVRTLLSGWGGDELISYDGYAYLPGLFWQGRFIQGIKEISILYKEKDYKYLRILKRSLRELIYPLFYKRMNGFFKIKQPQSDPFEFIQNQYMSSVRKFSFPAAVFRPGVHADQKLSFKHGHMLQRIENWAAASFGKKLEYSYPLLDRRIAEFALAIPEDLYAQREGHQRYLFRSAIAELLPKNIAQERKFLESEYEKFSTKLWDEMLILWIQKNENNLENKNCYVDRNKIIKRIKVYLDNKRKGQKDISMVYALLSILISNLETKNTKQS